MYLPELYFPLKSRLQGAGLIERAKKRGANRKRCECAPWPGMMPHQDSSIHEWVAGRKWDLIATMDGATSG